MNREKTIEEEQYQATAEQLRRLGMGEIVDAAVATHGEEAQSGTFVVPLKALRGMERNQFLQNLNVARNDNLTSARLLEKFVLEFADTLYAFDDEGNWTIQGDQSSVSLHERIAYLLLNTQRFSDICQTDAANDESLEEHAASQIIQSLKALGTIHAAINRVKNPETSDPMPPELLLENYYLFFRLGQLLQCREMLGGMTQLASNARRHQEMDSLPGITQALNSQISELKAVCRQIQKENGRKSRHSADADSEAGPNQVRMKTVKLISNMLRPWLDEGVVYHREASIIISNLKSLAQKGCLAPDVEPKLLTQQEAADMLNIALSNFKKLEQQGVFPFKRKMVHSAVRYRNTDVIAYMMSDDADGMEGTDGKRE